MSDPPLRVVIAEDNYLVREGTRRLLEDGGGVDVVAAVGTADELLDAVRRLRPGVVITDIRMPPGHHMEGIAAAHAIRAGHPGTGVVVLSQHADDAYAFELFKNGTAGLAYLLKDRIGDLDELRAALTAVACGGSSIDPVVVEALVASRTRLADSALRWLTPRELDVLREMAHGRANPGIAAALVLSESAVEKHVSSIFAKLGLGPEPTQDRRVTAVLTFLGDSPGTAGLARSDALARATLSPGDTAGAWQLVGNLYRRTFFPHDTGEAARRHGCRPYNGRSARGYQRFLAISATGSGKHDPRPRSNYMAHDALGERRVAVRCAMLCFAGATAGQGRVGRVGFGASAVHRPSGLSVSRADRENPGQISGRQAPLAQSAERLHGKEKVYGSIP